jgi:pimeloyl-ACP methyl ester carboxylesterase
VIARQIGRGVTPVLRVLLALRAKGIVNAVARRAIARKPADVLLLAGADDHYVPLKQLRRQAARLVRARSVTTRTFTAAEQASNHCQVGNIGAAVRVIQGWLELSMISRMAEKGGAAEEFARQSEPTAHQWSGR